MFVTILVACGSREPAQPESLSPDESYLVDAYVRVRHASGFYPYQREIGDSLFTRLAGEIDTVRVARTVAALNATPERWNIVFERIEERLNPVTASPSETTRG